MLPHFADERIRNCWPRFTASWTDLSSALVHGIWDAEQIVRGAYAVILTFPSFHDSSVCCQWRVLCKAWVVTSGILSWNKSSGSAGSDPTSTSTISLRIVCASSVMEYCGDRFCTTFHDPMSQNQSLMFSRTHLSETLFANQTTTLLHLLVGKHI